MKTDWEVLFQQKKWNELKDAIRQESQQQNDNVGGPSSGGRCPKRENSSTNPFLQAVENEAPLDVFEALIQHRPQDLQRDEPYTMKPLHWLCNPTITTSSTDNNNNNNENIQKKLKIDHLSRRHLIIQAVMRAYPDALWQFVDGTTPLHILLQHRPSAELVSEMIFLAKQCQPGSQCYLLTMDRELQTPLHVALQDHASIAVIRVLLDECPQAAKVRCKGYTPIHLAAYNGVNQQTMTLLMKLIPIGLWLETKNENKDSALAMPFHNADLWCRRRDHRPKEAGIFPDGTGPDRAIERVPNDLMTPAETVRLMLDTLPRHFRSFEKENSTSNKASNAVSVKHLRLAQKRARNLHRELGKKAPDDLVDIIKSFGQMIKGDSVQSNEGLRKRKRL